MDERRKTFLSESAAVIAFSNAIRMELQDLLKDKLPATPTIAETLRNQDSRALPAAQDRSTALNFWVGLSGIAIIAYIYVSSTSINVLHLNALWRVDLLITDLQ